MATAPNETSVVEHEVRIDARPETVFSYFTDPAKLVLWMGSQATLDPRPGGVFRIGFGEEAAALGAFVELEPAQRIVFTWGWEARWFQMPPQSTTVEVLLVPDGEGTIVRLAHSRLPAGASGFHRAGWRHYLGRLAIAARGAAPGPDLLAEALRAENRWPGSHPVR
jgi:uncharacterized protein YndB with AHSA1/START domain